MPASRRGVDKHVLARGTDRAVQHRLQRLVARLAFLERQIVAENNKALGPPADQIDDVAQIAHVGLVDLDKAQSLVAVRSQHGLDQRAFPLAACAGPQPVVGRPEEHTSELQSLMRLSYAVFCLKQKT